MSRAAWIRPVLAVAGTIFLLALLTGWYLGHKPRRPMFSLVWGNSGHGFGNAWAPPYPMTDKQRSTRAYCDVEHNIVVVAFTKVGIQSDPTKASFRTEGIAATVTREDANTIVLLWYDEKRTLMRTAKIRIPPGLAGAVKEAYHSMPREQTIIGFITAHMPEPEAEICRAEYDAIQR